MGATPFTAGRVARLVDVDVKTVHNWARTGRASCWRTVGRHLRFHPLEVVRLLRSRGLPVPAEVVHPRPRVVAAGLGVDAPEVAALRVDSLYVALMEFGTESHDVLVVHLDRVGSVDVTELGRSVRAQFLTGGRGLLGIAADTVLRDAFVAAGADDCVASVAELAPAVAWVVGASPVRAPGTRCQ